MLVTILVVAEKPSVARDIAKVLGATKREQGFISGGGYKITWAIGHLVALAQPAEVNPAWKRWSKSQLPMLPDAWPLSVLPKTRKQFTVVKRLLRARDIKQVVCATDAGREGELIFRYIYEQAGSKKPVSRLWISSLTASAIRAGMDRLKPASAYDALADAARGRSRADWLVGMNLSRAYTLYHDDKYSVGRVQTPTLSMVVDRERAIRNFVPEHYLEVVAQFYPEDGTPQQAYKATYFDPGKQKSEQAAKPAAKQDGDTSKSSKATRLPIDGIEAAAIMGRARTGQPVLAELTHKNRSIPPPKLYDLTELQRDANRMFGMRASQTLKAAQALYERHKLISYPRTDSRHLSSDVAKTLDKVVKAIAGRYPEPGLVADGSGTRPLGKRFVDDTKVTDHHAIIPTAVRKKKQLDPETPEGKIFDLICRRLLAAWHPDHRYATTTAIVEIHQPTPAGPVDSPDPPPVDHYKASGKTVTEVGWKVLERRKKRKQGADEQNLVAGLKRGQPQVLADIKPENRTTKPPPPLTEATLLTAMETAGKSLDDRELSDAMRERGLGTPATRAATIETLLARSYIERKGKALHATAKGERLIDLVHPHVRSPEMTGQWEHRLRQVERGEIDLQAFMQGICGYVQTVVGDVTAGRRPQKLDAHTSFAPSPSSAKPRASSPTPSAAKQALRPPVSQNPGDSGNRPTPPRTPRRSTNRPRQPGPTAQTSLFAGMSFDPPAAQKPRRRGAGTGENRHIQQPRSAAPRQASAGRQTRNTQPARATPSQHAGSNPWIDNVRESPPPQAPAFNPYLDAPPEPAIRREDPGPPAFIDDGPMDSRPPPSRAPRANTEPRVGASAPRQSDEPPAFDNFAPEFESSPADDAGGLDAFDPGAPPDWLTFAPVNDEPGPSRDVDTYRPAPEGPPPGPPPVHAATPSNTPVAPTQDLGELLHQRFKFENFRPHQEVICRTITDGRDVLVVMPTGAGKSLCYQLPGLARGGTTLVVSPLIALMDDQVGKLQELGLRAERIHSGLERGRGSEIYRSYLSGQLDFLFVAPERLGLPGFVDMLTRRQPSLIAVDEAHCISQWGHDFRPDYRMLGERLPVLRPAPIVALTATATPRVQDDIATQLGLQDPRRFILGFRRTNIGVEVVDMPPRARAGAIEELLKGEGRLPAIVYASTRKQSEELAAALEGTCKIAAYHAGMAAGRRDKIQTRFLKGKLDAIVATVAFGMGIDKPDVRTVVHAALPGTVEGYYQEIGRAGRDGKPSRAVLMHSYADRRTHEYFQERDYPEPDDLKIIYDALLRRPLARSTLAKRTGFSQDELDRALDKLWIHGGVRYDADDKVCVGTSKWLRPYSRQRTHRQEQLEKICQFAASATCRMLRLVEHFGDQEDSGKPCGSCDVCAPKASLTRTARQANDEEQALMGQLLRQLNDGRDVAVGKLFREHFEGDLPRREFETLLAALTAAGLVEVTNDSFKKGSRTITYRRVALSEAGMEYLLSGGTKAIQVTEQQRPKTQPKRRRKAATSKTGKKSSTKSSKSKQPSAPVDEQLAETLREWRLQTSRKKGIGAHRVLTNRALEGLAAAKPRTADELLEVTGIGPTTVKKYGEDLLRLIRG